MSQPHSNKEAPALRLSERHWGQALADFAGWADPGGRKVLVVVVDGSGGHTAKKLAVPPNVVLHRQPSFTLELQPAEHLWPLVREGLANGCSPPCRR